MTEQARWARVGQALEELEKADRERNGFGLDFYRSPHLGWCVAVVRHPSVGGNMGTCPTLLAALEAALGLTDDRTDA